MLSPTKLDPFSPPPLNCRWKYRRGHQSAAPTRIDRGKMLSRAARPALKAASAASARYALSTTHDIAVTKPSSLTSALHRPIAVQTANYATLKEIEGRLKSIRNIEKITKTMKIVASTKLTRAQKAMQDSRSYGQTSNTVFEKAETKPLEAEGKKDLLIICSSDKGLCGGIHSSMTRKARAMLGERPNTDLVIIGEKCKAQLGRSNGKNIQLSFAGIGKDVPTFADAQAIADQIVLLPQDYGQVSIMHNKFLNAQSYESVTVEAYSEEAITESRKSAVRSISARRPLTIFHSEHC